MPAAYTIGTTAVQITEADPNKRLVIQNLSATNDVYVGNSSAVTTSDGLRIRPNEQFEFRNDLIETEFRGGVWMIAGVAGNSVRVGVVG